MVPMQQWTFRSYSLRNTDGQGRIWGNVNEADEREDNSESDEEQETQQRKCLSGIKRFLHALFPNRYPFLWLMLPLFFSAILAIVAYGDYDETEGQHLVILSQEPPVYGAISDDDRAEPTFVSHPKSAFPRHI